MQSTQQHLSALLQFQCSKSLRVGAMPLGNTTKLFVYTCGLLGSSATDRREGQNMGTRSFLSTKAQWLNKDATMRQKQKRTLAGYSCQELQANINDINNCCRKIKARRQERKCKQNCHARKLGHIHCILVCISLSPYTISLTATSSSHRPKKFSPTIKRTAIYSDKQEQ